MTGDFGAHRPRKAIAPRWVLLGLVLSFVMAFGVAAYLYQRYVAYDRVAALHLLDDPDWALRVDLEQVALYEPFREHLLPLVLAGSEKDPRLKPRLERLRQHSRVELGVDIRELAFSQKGARWVLTVGGLFPKGGVAEGILRVLEEEQRKASLDPVRGVVSLPNGVLVQQATDGAVLFASDQPSLSEAFSSGAREGAGLPSQGAASLRVGLDDSKASGIRTLTATLVLDSPHRLHLDVETVPESGPIAAAERWLSAKVAALANVAPGSVRLEVSGPNQWHAELEMSAEQLDALGRHLGKHLRAEVFSAP